MKKQILLHSSALTLSLMVSAAFADTPGAALTALQSANSNLSTLATTPSLIVAAPTATQTALQTSINTLEATIKAYQTALTANLATPASSGAALPALTAAATAGTSAMSMVAVPGSSTMKVMNGCAVPNLTLPHHTFYVDPIKGSMSGDGSQAHPWSTLHDVFAPRYQLVANAYINVDPVTNKLYKPNPNGPIKSGDTILLMNGDHGSLLIRGWGGGTAKVLGGYDNDQFVTIAAAPGQNPVIDGLTVVGGKFIFQGLTIKSLLAPSAVDTWGPNSWLVKGAWPGHDLIFDKNTVESTDDASAWTPTDWHKNAMSGFTEAKENCVSVTNNSFKNLAFAMGVGTFGNNILVYNNTIDEFEDDGIDYGSNNMIIDHNTITNSHGGADGFHRDAMQGVPNNTTIPLSNISITNNLVINQTHPYADTAWFQGIDAFDGIWNNVYVANNTVITNSYQGIYYMGVHNAVIENNTVVPAVPDVGSNGNLIMPTAIDVLWSKSGVQSSNVIVRNNIAANFGAGGTNVVADHNLMIESTAYAANIGQPKPPSNFFAVADIATVFTKYDPAHFTYDTSLQPVSQAIGSGSAEGLPPTDRLGNKRTATTLDLGAQVFTGTRMKVDAQCGPATLHPTYTLGYLRTQLCSLGTPDTLVPVYDAKIKWWKWTCKSPNGGQNKLCGTAYSTQVQALTKGIMPND